MLQITPHMRILVCVEPVDFRKGIDGLASLCRRYLGHDPFSGAVFVFRNRRGASLKLLLYDSQGFWICQKRLSKGRFQWWPEHGADRINTLDAYQLQLLLWNGDPTGAGTITFWKHIEQERYFVDR